MSHNGHDTYLEGRILSADPLELVRLLYQGCGDEVREARRRLADGDIAGRSRAVSNACEILTELLTSLDQERGGDISRNLALLYDYMQRRLIDANIQQADGPLAEVLRLLGTLAEGWSGVRAQNNPLAAETQQLAPETEPVTETNPWGQPFQTEAEPVAYFPFASEAVETQPWTQPWMQPVSAGTEPVAYPPSLPAAAEANPWAPQFRNEDEPVAFPPFAESNPWAQQFSAGSRCVVTESNPWGQSLPAEAEPVAHAWSF